ncbi:hypothetical protein RND81_01G027600 [Saponaria officinalis]|uniref:Uncharacterized protein n=1 Tax=Saponaria officinalis TaxID=3572 RepID=A0AAW1NB59_SAPOF
MSGMSKLGITLTSLFSLILFALLSQLLYLLYRCRRHHHRKITRIEPATPPPPPPTSTTIPPPKFEPIYGPSRVLFTINEEEKDDLENIEMVNLSQHFSENFCVEDYVISMVGCDDHFDVEPPFLTPCASPPYYTPSPSPPRDG